MSDTCTNCEEPSGDLVNPYYFGKERWCPKCIDEYEPPEPDLMAPSARERQLLAAREKRKLR